MMYHKDREIHSLEDQKHVRCDIFSRERKVQDQIQPDDEESHRGRLMKRVIIKVGIWGVSFPASECAMPRNSLQYKAPQKWKSRWENGTKGEHLRKLPPCISPKYLDLHKGRKRPHSALLTQLRTGKLGSTNLCKLLSER